MIRKTVKLIKRRSKIGDGVSAIEIVKRETFSFLFIPIYIRDEIIKSNL